MSPGDERDPRQLFDRLGQALRQLRQERELRQYEVAERAGITRTMLSSYEAGKVMPHLATLASILEALDADLETLDRALRRAEGRAELPAGPRARLEVAAGERAEPPPRVEAQGRLEAITEFAARALELPREHLTVRLTWESWP